MSQWFRAGTGLRFDPTPHHHDGRIRLLIDQASVDTVANTPGTGVCDRLKDALNTGLFPQSLIDQFSNWCNTNRDVEPIVRKIARYLFSHNDRDNVPPRFLLDGRSSRHWPDDGALAQSIYEAWRDDVTA
jgi:hypothetical protein